MQNRRGFLGNLMGGAAAGLFLPASIAKASIEIVGDEELISRVEKASEIVLTSDKALARSVLEGSFFGASNETIMELSEKKYESWLRHHLKINQKYGIPDMIEAQVNGWPFLSY